MEGYSNYLNTIKNRVLRISDLNSKLSYLLKEKGEFVTLNRGTEAEMVIKWFDTFIDEVKVDHTRNENAKLDWESKYWYSEYELRQFIHTATRWTIDAVLDGRTKDNPYSIFDNDVENARDNFDLFAAQLRNKLAQSQNWKAIEIDLSDRFLHMINQYCEWYEKNKTEIEIFNPYNPYELMLSAIESTKKEILKYFPEETSFQINPIKIDSDSPPTANENKSNTQKFEIKPKFKSELRQTIFDLLKDFFSEEHQKQLEQILITGNDAAAPLYFLDSGNRLADSFKQLYNTDIITGCEKIELESWINRNFKYRHRKEIKAFSLRYLNDIISTNKELCRNPILNVVIEKATGNILIKKA